MEVRARGCKLYLYCFAVVNIDIVIDCVEMILLVSRVSCVVCEMEERVFV